MHQVTKALDCIPVDNLGSLKWIHQFQLRASTTL